jgi:cyclopropane-fatty-acyl-phospholipid synthase
VNKYIFPGGFLPSLQVLQDVPSEHASLELVDRLSMGVDYAETLRLWDHAFISRSEEVRDLGFDPTFIRMWHFYLEYSRAGFASGYLDDYQLTYAKADS